MDQQPQIWLLSVSFLDILRESSISEMVVRGTELYSLTFIACFPPGLWCLTGEMDYVLLCEPNGHLLPIPTACII